MRWSPWQSRAAAGLAGDRTEPDLPGVLARLEFPDGPEFHGSRICLIHDTAEGRWGATAKLTHSGVGMLSDDECERLASRLGSMLVGLGHREVVDRVSLLVRTEQAAELTRALAATGVTIQQVDAETLHVTGLDPTLIGRRSLAAGVALHELTPQRISLEDQYMKLTGDHVEYRSGGISEAPHAGPTEEAPK